MKIALIVKPGHADSGVGRYAHELEMALQSAGHQVILVHPTVPIPNWVLKLVKQYLGYDLLAFFLTYPIWISYPLADIYHFTGQNLATLLMFRRPKGKIVITVHDIIPWLVRNDRQLCLYRNIADRLFDRLANKQLLRSDFILTDSEYSKTSLIVEFKYHDDRVQTVSLGVD